LLLPLLPRAVHRDAPEVARDRLRHRQHDAVLTPEQHILLDRLVEDEAVTPLHRAETEAPPRVAASQQLAEHRARLVGHMHDRHPSRAGPTGASAIFAAARGPSSDEATHGRESAPEGRSGNLRIASNVRLGNRYVPACDKRHAPAAAGSGAPPARLIAPK